MNVRSKDIGNVQVSIQGHRNISPSEYSWEGHSETKTKLLNTLRAQ